MKGNLSAEITQLLQEHEAPLLRYVSRLLHDPDTARDIVQETFIKYLDHRSANRPEIQNVKAWLYRVAHNLALDHLRRFKRQQALGEESQEILADTREKTPDFALEQHDSEAAAWHALHILSERDRQIVMLKVIEERSYKQIAKAMNLTVSNVGFILHNSLKKLARELRKEFSGQP